MLSVGLNLSFMLGNPCGKGLIKTIQIVIQMYREQTQDGFTGEHTFPSPGDQEPQQTKTLAESVRKKI